MVHDMACNAEYNDRQKPRVVYDMSFSSLVNMTNCYKHCEHFFNKCKIIHFNLLISYWIMAGFLGTVASVEDAYHKGHRLLIHLIFEERFLKPSDKDPEMIEFPILEPDMLQPPCTHQGFCITPNLGFVDMLDLVKLGDVVCTHGMLKTVPINTPDQHTPSGNKNTTKGSVLLIDGNHLSRQVFHPPKRLKCLAYFDPSPSSLKPLLEKVNHLSVLLLRGCQWLPQTDIPYDKFRKLTVLEISGSTHLTTIPSQTVSELPLLKCLNLSHLPIQTLPHDFFEKLVELRWVILRGCSELLSLPTIKTLKQIEALDLSHCTALTEFKTTPLKFSHLQMLDLSYTAMLSIPALKETTSLTHLFLRDVKVSVLNSLKQLTSLHVLDLSGARNVKRINQVKDNKNIIILNLSRTSINSVDIPPDIIDFPKLTNMILQGCTLLKQLPAMITMTSLEVLDLSGCEKLAHLPEDLSNLKSLKELNLSGCTSLELREDLFLHMSCLLKLDLSGTKVERLPSFVNLISICKLSLRGLQLASLETLDTLSTIVELDLSRLEISPPHSQEPDLSRLQISPPQPEELNVHFVQSLENLQILNLSQTSVANLPDLSKLQSLRELLLADCQDLKNVPDLHTLTDLEILDLSLPCQAKDEIAGQIGSCLSVPCNLRKLVLSNRSGVKKLFPLTSLGKLDFLDLRGTDVEITSYENMAPLKCIQLPAQTGFSGVRLSRMGNLHQVIDWNDNPQGHLRLERKIFCPSEIQIDSTIDNKSSMSAGDNQFFHLKEDNNQGSWEAFVHHFSVSLPPKGGKDEFMYLDGDKFILRGDLCWTRRLLNLELKGKCVEIHGFSVLPEEEVRNVVQNAHNAAFVSNSFLGSLDPFCCKVMKVCCIRRCREMKSVLGDVTGVQVSDGVTRCPERLVLSDLVNLESICTENVSSESVESLTHMHVDCCPKLKKVILASQVPKNLKTLIIKFCEKLQTLFEENIYLSNLQELSLFELPELDSVKAKLPCLRTLSISQCPRLKDLDTIMRCATSLSKLRLDSCSGLVTLFDNAGTSSSTLPKLHGLQALSLWRLPKLKSIGGELAMVDLSTLDLDPSLPCSIIQQFEKPAMI